MALGATIFRFALEVSDLDRDVYAAEELSIARHPSETDGLMITRVLAWALEAHPLLQLGRGLAFPEEPALSVADGNGGIAVWVEIGAPSAERLHRASKLATQLKLYTHRDIDFVLQSLNGKKIHRASQLQIISFPPSFIADLERRIERRNQWNVVRTENRLYVTVGAATIETALDLRSLET